MWDTNSLFASGISTTFISRLEFKNLFIKKGWNTLLKKAKLKILSAKINVFKLLPDAGCDNKSYYFVIVKKSLNYI